MNSDVTSQVGPLNELLGAVSAAIPGAGVDQQMLTEGVTTLKENGSLFSEVHHQYLSIKKAFASPVTRKRCIKLNPKKTVIRITFW